MNAQRILYALVILVIGLVLGGSGTFWWSNKKIEKANMEISDAQRVTDSVVTANIEQKKFYEKAITKLTVAIANSRTNLKQREDDFKNDTIIPSDDELIQRARAVTNND